MQGPKPSPHVDRFPLGVYSSFKKILDHCINLLRKQKDKIYLLVDEVGFRKKGKHSACVGHQYIGSIGKNDNGQVAVAVGLSAGNFYCPVEMELFMPGDWGADEQRRSKAGIPAWKNMRANRSWR